MPQAVDVAKISEAVDRPGCAAAEGPFCRPAAGPRGRRRASAHARFEQSPIREFVPQLVERRARAELSRNAGLLTVSS